MDEDKTARRFYNSIGPSYLGEKFNLHNSKHSYVLAVVAAVVLFFNLMLFGFVAQNSGFAENAVTPATSRTDADQDGFKDYLEVAIGTDVNKKCGINAWPPDVNNDGTVNVIDLLIESKMTSKKGDSTFNARFDLNVDSVVDTTDVSLVSKYNGRRCDTPNHPQSETQIGCERADVNKDGLVNQNDLNIIAGKSGSNDATTDVNGDGTVNVLDLQLVSQESYGKTCKSDISQLAGFAGALPPCQSADVNKDGLVNVIDLQQVAAKFGTGDAGADVNGDKTVNALDLHLVANYFSQACVAPAAAAAQLSASSTPVKETCQKGDVNKDGVVNVIDMQLVSTNVGKKGTQYDTNGDGIINVIDLQQVFSSYDKKCADLQSSPSTPSTQTSTQTPTSTSCTLTGDIDKNGSVNVIDLQQVTAAVNSGSKDTKFDVNGDGNVNIVDLQQVTVNQGKKC